MVGPGWDMHVHQHKGERLFIVPGLRVREPVPWNMIPYVIERAKKQVLKETLTDNPCGGCNVCCFLTYIPAINKPSRTMCRECIPGLGCGSYKVRPLECSTFKCDWLRSQEGPDPMAKELRPDRSGVMFTPDSTNGENDLFEVHVMRMTEVAQGYIDTEQAKGRRAKFVDHYYGSMGICFGDAGRYDAHG